MKNYKTVTTNYNIMKSIYKRLERCYNIVNASDCREQTEQKRKERRGKAMKRIEEQYNEYITIIIEKSTARADITLKEPEDNAYYYAELNSTYGEQAVKQSIDAKNDTIRTEVTGFHVSGLITETGTMMLSCDIYAQDLDIQESYLAYNVGKGYAVYDEISLTRIAIYPHAEAVRQFFAIRVNALETETLKKLY